jgi:FKBP-type peptidyl-prolyl cis-trans isomerase
VHYTGLLSNGTPFDSSVGRGEPIAFPLGAGRVIKGWDEGIALLRVGDQATLIIPPQLGYGARGKGEIPPNATLIFIIEVVGIKDAPSTGDASMRSHRRSVQMSRPSRSIARLATSAR